VAALIYLRRLGVGDAEALVEERPVSRGGVTN